MIGLEIAALVCLAFWVGLALDRSRAWPRESVLPKAGEQSRGHPTSSAWSHFSGRGSRWRGRSYPFRGGRDSGS